MQKEVRIRINGVEETVELETLLFQLRRACQYMEEGHPLVRLVLPSGEKVDVHKIERDGGWYARLVVEMDLGSLLGAISGKEFRKPYWIPIHISSQNERGTSEFARMVREGKMKKEDIWWFYSYQLHDNPRARTGWIARAQLEEEGWKFSLLLR